MGSTITTDPLRESFAAAGESRLAPSQLLGIKIRLGEGRLNSASCRFWQHMELRTLFPEFLLELRSVVHGGLHLMTAARDRAQQLEANDPVAAILAKYLDHHIAEEADHEAWLLDDMEFIGMDRDWVLSRPPSPAVATLIGAQYAWILHAHPVALFGYLILLEGNPPLIEHLEEIQRKTGYPAEAFRCLREHAIADPDHIMELNRTLDEMPLSPEQTSLVAMSAFHALDSIANLLDELVERHPTVRG